MTGVRLVRPKESNFHTLIKCPSQKQIFEDHQNFYTCEKLWQMKMTSKSRKSQAK
jgi:hypothetical protein